MLWVQVHNILWNVSIANWYKTFKSTCFLILLKTVLRLKLVSFLEVMANHFHRKRCQGHLPPLWMCIACRISYLVTDQLSLPENSSSIQQSATQLLSCNKWTSSAVLRYIAAENGHNRALCGALADKALSLTLTKGKP